MRKKLAVAAKNTLWLYSGLNAYYFGDEYGVENSMEKAIFREATRLSRRVFDIVIKKLCENCDLPLLDFRLEYILRAYSLEYPELCLILCFRQVGVLSPVGVSPVEISGDLVTAVNRIFGISRNSPIPNVDFYAKNVPVIRITDGVFTLGTDLPRFSTVADVEKYYRDKARIAEIAKLCELWIRKFYS